MPTSRRPRAPARARVPLPRRECQALLADEETRCSSQSQGRRGRYCPAHGREYVQLTGAYKRASERVDALEVEIQRAKTSVGVLITVAAVDAAIALANRYLDALGEEIDGREAHHKRFFQTVDENHSKWLKRRRQQEAGAARLFERLRKRREEVIAMEVAVKRDEERRRAMEDEARLRAIEDTRLWGAQLKAVQARRVLDERTNTAVRNQENAGAKSEWVSTGFQESVAPAPYSYQTPRYPPRAVGTYYNTTQNTKEMQPLPLLPPPPPLPPRPAASTRAPLPPPPPLPPRPAATTRAPVSASPIRSWPIDIERQAPPTARASWQANPEWTENSVDIDCDSVRSALFWIAAFFVFCYLVVVEALHRGYRVVVG